MTLKVFTTRQAAEKVGISLITLERWLLAKKIERPKVLLGNARLWTVEDIARLRKAKKQFYKKGSGRKPKPKK